MSEESIPVEGTIISMTLPSSEVPLPSCGEFIKFETKEPDAQQYIVFRTGGIVFAGYYIGERRCIPFSMTVAEPPVFILNEWMPIRIWG